MFKKVAFHFTGCARINKEGIWIRGQFGYLVDELANHVDQLDLLLDEINEDNTDENENKTDYLIKNNNIRHIPLGSSGGFVSFIKRIIMIKKALINSNYQFILMREPSRRSLYIRLFIEKTPIVFLMGGDWQTQLNSPFRTMSKYRAHLYTMSLKRAMKSALLFVNNEDLYSRWSKNAPGILLTRTTSLGKGQILDKPLKRFQNNDFVLLYVGRLDSLKGLETLLQAFSKIHLNNEVSWRLDIIGVGNPNFTKKLLKLVHELNLKPYVKFLGFIKYESIFDYYRTSDLFILPTLVENVSRTIWEAMASSCPVITTPVGGQKYVFKDKKDVLFFNPGNSKDLLKKIIYISKNRSLVKQLCENGLKTVKNNTIEIRVEEMLYHISKWNGNHY